MIINIKLKCKLLAIYFIKIGPEMIESCP